jgi:hypothetical protein
MGMRIWDGPVGGDEEGRRGERCSRAERQQEGLQMLRLERCEPLTSMVKKLKLPPIIFLAKLCAAIADEAYEP